MHAHSDPTAIRLAVRRYATHLVDTGGAGNGTAMNDDAGFHAQFDTVLNDIATRLLAGAEVTPEPGCIPHSRAAYTVGFVAFLVSTTQQLSADAAVASASDSALPAKIARGIFAGFDEREFTAMVENGVAAIGQMLAVVQQAGQLEPWLTSFSDALIRVISTRNDQGNDQLVEHFVTLPITVRRLQSAHAD